MSAARHINSVFFCADKECFIFLLFFVTKDKELLSFVLSEDGYELTERYYNLSGKKSQ